MPPAELLARARNLLLAERRTVGCGRAGLARRAIADDGAAGDQRRLVGYGPRILDGQGDGFRIVAVDAGGMPVRGPEALDLVVGDGEAGRAVDRDLIVVEQHDEAAELEMAGQRNRLVADALHQAAVARHAIGVVVDDVVAVTAR